MFERALRKRELPRPCVFIDVFVVVVLHLTKFVYVKTINKKSVLLCNYVTVKVSILMAEETYLSALHFL